MTDGATARGTDRHSQNIIGAGWMTIAMAAYVINDSMVKLAAEDTPLFEAVFIRGLIVTTLLAAFGWQRGELQGLQISTLKPVAPRVIFEMIGTVAFLTALTHMEIANITAVLQVVPLLVTFAAARLLRERVRAYRWISILFGFVGVMIIVQPGTDGFNQWSILALFAVLTIIARELATRRIASDIPSVVVGLCTAVGITLMAAVLSIFQGWTPVTLRLVLLVATASIFLSIGYVASVVTMRTGDVSFTAAFRYTVTVFAIILQIVVFRDMPDLSTWIGTAIIVGAGLYAYNRELANKEPDLGATPGGAPVSGTILDG